VAKRFPEERDNQRVIRAQRRTETLSWGDAATFMLSVSVVFGEDKTIFLKRLEGPEGL
jgi:hypothetical protein